MPAIFEGDTTAITSMESTDKVRVVYSDSGLWSSAVILKKNLGSTTPYFKITDTKASGTDGGTFTSGSFSTRTLNTIDSDPSSILVSLSSNQFTLPAGTYQFNITAPAFNVTRHKAVLYNATAGANALIGTAQYSSASPGLGMNQSIICGVVTIAVQSSFEVRHRCETTAATTGLGVASSFGVSEVYTTVQGWRL